MSLKYLSLLLTVVEVAVVIVSVIFMFSPLKKKSYSPKIVDFCMISIVILYFADSIVDFYRSKYFSSVLDIICSTIWLVSYQMTRKMRKL